LILNNFYEKFKILNLLFQLGVFLKKLRVALIFGGKSGEHEVSITSAMSIYHALDKTRYEVTLIGIDKTGRWLLPDQTLMLTQKENPRLIKLNKQNHSVALVSFESNKPLVDINAPSSSPLPSHFDVVLPILHGTFGEDGTIQGLLELANLPYVGSGVLGSSVGMDKDVSRRLLAAAGIPVVKTRCYTKSQVVKNGDQVISEIQKEFAFPFFVKPANMGSSVGVSKVKSAADIRPKLFAALAYDTKILVEEGVDARELECAVLGNEEPRASLVGEIVPHHEFYSYEAKYIDENGADLKIPAENISAEVVKQVQDLALRAFRALECRGLARVDFFLDRKTNKLYLNEINTIPGFTNVSMYPKLWEASGVPYAQLLDELIQLAIERHAEKVALKTSFDPHEE
jgi:D-alanine-D-alanine ligase